MTQDFNKDIETHISYLSPLSVITEGVGYANLT